VKTIIGYVMLALGAVGILVAFVLSNGFWMTVKVLALIAIGYIWVDAAIHLIGGEKKSQGILK